MFLANQLMKFCIGGENLDTTASFAASVDLPSLCSQHRALIQSCESNYDNSLQRTGHKVENNNVQLLIQRIFS